MPPRVRRLAAQPLGDLCVASLVALAERAFARLLAFADLAPLIIEEGAAKAIARLAHEARQRRPAARRGGACDARRPGASAPSSSPSPSSCARAASSSCCALRQPRRRPRSPPDRPTPRGEERLSAARLAAERDAAGRTALAAALRRRRRPRRARVAAARAWFRRHARPLQLHGRAPRGGRDALRGSRLAGGSRPTRGLTSRSSRSAT